MMKKLFTIFSVDISLAALNQKCQVIFSAVVTKCTEKLHIGRGGEGLVMRNRDFYICFGLGFLFFKAFLSLLDTELSA